MSVTTIPDVKTLRESDKALLVLTDEGDEVWVPKSVIDDDSEVYAMGHTGTLIIQERFAKKVKELNGYVD